MSFLFSFQLTGPRLGEVSPVQSVRKGEAKEETNGSGGGVQGERKRRRRKRTGGASAPPRTISHFTWACSKRIFCFLSPSPPPFGLLPPPATVQSHRLNHSKLLFDGLDKPSGWLCPASGACCRWRVPVRSVWGAGGHVPDGRCSGFLSQQKVAGCGGGRDVLFKGGLEEKPSWVALEPTRCLLETRVVRRGGEVGQDWPLQAESWEDAHQGGHCGWRRGWRDTQISGYTAQNLVL